MNILGEVLSSSGFMPHGYCYMWKPTLIWLHVISDALIFLAYMSIPITLLYVVRKRRDLPFSWIFVCFGVFIVACGLTHAMEIWTLWRANYWISGAVKALTAAASVPTAILLVRLVPKCLSIPSPTALQKEIAVREQAEKALRASEASFRAVAETAHDAIISADGHGRIVFWNAGAEHTFGYSSFEALGKPLTFIMPERFHDAHREGISRFISGSEARVVGKTIELVGRRKDLTEFPLELSLASWKNGDAQFFTGILRDITERRIAQEGIERLNEHLERRSKELEAANKELEAFTYSVSHDLRAPLRHIDGFSKLLEERFGPELRDEVRESISLIRKGALEMGQLVDDLLNLAHVSRRDLNLQMTALDTVIKDVVTELDQQKDGRVIEWKIEKLPFVECDPGLIKQVFVNLLSNAVKFTRPREKANITVGVLHREGGNVIFVQDNGVGFNMKHSNKLFGTFQRLHRQEDFEGTGIGLATIQRIIQKHGGRVWAEAELNKGATFFFTLGSPGA